MLEEIATRQQKLGLSTRKLAHQLDISPTLLSLVLNKKRATSGDLTVRFKRWLNTPMADGGHNHPNTVYKEFMAERASFVSRETIRYYTEKLEPFILWCEKHAFTDMTLIERSTIGTFLAYIRLGRRNYGNIPLSNGSIKLHHQTLKTLFNYTAETRSMPNEWTNPVSAIKVKSGDAGRTEYSSYELSKIKEIINTNSDDVLRLRNTALVVVALLEWAMALFYPVIQILILAVQDLTTNDPANRLRVGRVLVCGHAQRSLRSDIEQTPQEASCCVLISVFTEHRIK
jgi:site-specific recombinase XerC